MYADIQESMELCLRILDLLEQDGQNLSASLDGDILEPYKHVVQAEIDRMQEVRRTLQRAMK